MKTAQCDEQMAEGPPGRLFPFALLADFLRFFGAVSHKDV
jgi:hypothetical protein